MWSLGIGVLSGRLSRTVVACVCLGILLLTSSGIIPVPTSESEAALGLMAGDDSFYLDTTDAYEVQAGVLPDAFVLSLAKGWNFVTVPPVGYGYTARTLGLLPNDVVVGWNSSAQTNDKSYIVGLSPDSADFAIEASTGYWVFATQAETLYLYGAMPTEPQHKAISLPPGGGWANIAFNSLNETRKASDIPGMYAGGSIAMVTRYDPVAKSYRTHIPGLGGDFTLPVGQGCWIYCSASGILSYDVSLRPPVASFTYSIDNLTVKVNASGSSSDAGIVSYAWDWGDGSPLEVLTTPTASHTYMQTSSAAVSSTTGRQAVGFPYIIFGYTYLPDGVTAAAGATVIVTNLRSLYSVTLTSDDQGYYQTELNEGTGGPPDSGGPMFGDTIRVVAIMDTMIGWKEGVVTYDPPYLWLDVTMDRVTPTITLVVTDAIGQTSSISKQVEWVHYSARPIASFTVSPDWGYPTTIFTFDASNSSDVETPPSELQVRWDWEDDGIWDTAWSTNKSAEHQFASIGAYVVSLQVMDTHGMVSAEFMYYYVEIWTPGWIPEDVDYFSNYEGAVGLGNSIAIDSNNKVHMSYATSNIGAIKYATNAAGSWSMTTIYSPGVPWNIDFDEATTSIALDSNDKAHISYYDCVNRDMKYATNVGGSWTSYTLDHKGAYGLQSSIGIDSNDKVHIGYFDWTSADLKYATNAGGSWACYAVDSNGYVGEHVSIAIDASNHVHMSYYDRTNQHLKYATDESGSWACYTLDSTGDAGFSDTSIAVDSRNKVHICYNAGTNASLKYATNVDGSWTYSTLDSTDDILCRCSIALDSSDNAHISYRGNNGLKYATNASGSWTCITLDSTRYWVSYNSIAVDSIDKVHIGYYGGGSGSLMYMHEA